MVIDATAWYAVILLAAGAIFWVWRSGERQVDALRDLARKLERLGARVLAASTRREILDVLDQDLAPALGPVWWRLYFYERTRRTLECGTEIIPIHAPSTGEPAAIAIAFRHRVPSRLRPSGAAKTAHILPCGLGEEAHGVLVLRGDRIAEIDNATLNYLSNLIGGALAQIEHAAGRELDARAEKRQAISEVLTRVIGEIEHEVDFPQMAPALADRLRVMMREEDRALVEAHAPAHLGAVRTTLLLEPDPARRREFLSALSERNIRAVPAKTIEEAADRLERFSFDLVLCSARLAEEGWAEVANRLGRRSRLVWLADTQTLRFVDGSSIAVLEGAADLDSVVSA